MDESLNITSDESDSTDDSGSTRSTKSSFSSAMSERNIWSKSHTYKNLAAFYRQIYEYYEEGTFTDVNVICEDGDHFQCHRLALAAASGYFHTMFRKSHKLDVHLKDIYGDTFRDIVIPYVYRSVQWMDQIYGDSIYIALQVSTTLQLKGIEDYCVHYLTQREIPMNWALEIYLHASASHIIALLPALSQFILKNLDRYSHEREFLSMSREDFKTLLSYFQTSSTTSEETPRLLDAILRWVCHSTDIREYRKLYFTELAGEVEFRFVSAACISEYFDRNVDSHPSEIPETSNLLAGSCSVISSETSLHAYVRTEADETAIFSLKGNVTEGFDWHHSYTMGPPVIRAMRIIESDGRLYHLKFQNKCFTFGSSSAIDLCTDMQSLALPKELHSVHKIRREHSRCHTEQFSLCSRRRKIYLRSSLIGFQRYHPEIDLWLPIPAVTDCEPTDVVCDDTRLYIINVDKQSQVSLFGAYDPRAGFVQQLNTEGLAGSTHNWFQSAVYHKGKIYLPEDDRLNECKGAFKMAVYDPTADRWDVQNLKSYHFYRTFGRQLASFNDHLWMFVCHQPDEGEANFELLTQTYDSYRQKWSYEGILKLNEAMSRLNVCSLDLTDVVAFKSL